MMNISRQDIAKTAFIMWFFAASVYVAWDVWSDYARKGLQEAFQAGYDASVNEFFGKLKASNCQPLEIGKTEKVQVVDVQCLKGSQNQQVSPETKPTGK